MLKKRIITVLTFLDGILFRTKNFKADYRYTKNFIDLVKVDEIVLIDISKNKFQKSFLDIVDYYVKNCFVPLSIGGGISDMDKANLFFDKGADKIVVSSILYKNQKLLERILKKYGRQSIIVGLDCKKKINDYSVICKSGTSNTNNSPIEIAKKIYNIGCGEILINSIDNDGSLLGYDLELIKKISSNVNCPIIALGGAGNWQHLLDLFNISNISGACTQNIYHFTDESINSAKKFLQSHKIAIRK